MTVVEPFVVCVLAGGSAAALAAWLLPGMGWWAVPFCALLAPAGPLALLCAAASVAMAVEKAAQAPPPCLLGAVSGRRAR